MSNMVYLMCSLPSLTFGQVPPISLDEFQSNAQSQLSAKHFKMLKVVDLHQVDRQRTKGVLPGLVDMLEEVQQDLSEIREARIRKRSPKLLSLQSIILDANPLEREKRIMQWQWDELEALESGETFTLTEVLVYQLKLQIVCRLHSFNVERGAEVLASVIDPSAKEEVQ